MAKLRCSVERRSAGRTDELPVSEGRTTAGNWLQWSDRTVLMDAGGLLSINPMGAKHRILLTNSRSFCAHSRVRKR